MFKHSKTPYYARSLNIVFGLGEFCVGWCDVIHKTRLPDEETASVSFRYRIEQQLVVDRS